MSKSIVELWREAVGQGLPEGARLLVVDVAQQTLTLVNDGQQEAIYPVSTSKNGLGHQLDSFRTPTGWHEIVDRYGEGEPAGRVFFEREPTERILPETEWSTDLQDDLIMTRILHLSGLEHGVNRGGSVDTFERYVYIHGANHEHQLGQPASHGCIHVGNREIIELFDRLKGSAAWCWIG